jgi:hypothetical protein
MVIFQVKLQMIIAAAIDLGTGVYLGKVVPFCGKAATHAQMYEENSDRSVTGAR